MSAILRAVDERLGRDVALKVLLPRFVTSRHLVECFVNEAHILAGINSRHVVAVQDQGTIRNPGDHEGLPFMVLELLRGLDLRSYAVKNWPLDPARVAHFALQACEGVAAIHGRGITHQDLKPDNLFVANESDGTDVIKVLDLGIARSPGSSPTPSTEGAGSPGYMSPEQLNEPRSIDARSDIWSLGAVLYELFAGRAPFEARDPRELCSQVLSSEAPPLALLRPDLPIGFVLTIERCLEADRDRRFQNIAQLAQSLAPYAETPPLDETERIQHQLDCALVPILTASPETSATHLRVPVAAPGPCESAGNDSAARESMYSIDSEMDSDAALPLVRAKDEWLDMPHPEA